MSEKPVIKVGDEWFEVVDIRRIDKGEHFLSENLTAATCRGALVDERPILKPIDTPDLPVDQKVEELVSAAEEMVFPCAPEMICPVVWEAVAKALFDKRVALNNALKAFFPRPKERWYNPPESVRVVADWEDEHDAFVCDTVEDAKTAANLLNELSKGS